MRTLAEEMRLKRESQRQQKVKGGEDNASTEKSLRFSLWDGVFYGGMSGLTGPFLVPFALLFNAPNILLSLLTTLPMLLGSAFQLLAPRILGWLKSRRKYLVMVFSVQAAGWLLLPWVAAIPDKRLALWACILLAVTVVSITYANSSVWLGYMGDLVPQRQRGRFFSKRNALLAATTFAGTLAAGLLLQGLSSVYLAFALLFIVASVTRWLSAACYHRMREIPAKLPKPGEFSISRFFHRAPRSDFGRYVTFTMLLQFAAYLAAPFFVVYQLQVLKLDYLSFTVLQTASVIGSVFVLQAWGRVIDWRGTRWVLVASSVMIGLVPLLYLMTYPGMSFLLLFSFELFSGVAWSGFNLATSNYALEATSAESRTYVLTYNSLLNNFSIFFAGIAGGLLLNALGGAQAAVGPFLILFAVSGVLRLFVALGGASRLRELGLVQVRFGEGLVSGFISVVPHQGAAMALSGEEPAEFRDEVEHRLTVQRNVEEQLEQLEEGEGVVERMGPEEREIYKKKFLENAKK